MLVHLAADAIPLELCIAGQQVPQLLVRLSDCLVVSFLGFLEHLTSLLNLHLAGCNIYRRQDSVSRLRGFLEILQRLRPSCNSPGKNLALLGQPLLFNHSEYCNYVCKIFLIVPTGVNRHAEVGRVGKLGLEDLRIFLGRDNVYHGDVRNRQPMRQLPLLALSVLQPVLGLEGGTILAWCQSPVPSRSFLKEDFGRTCRNPAIEMVAWRFAECKNFLVPKTTCLCQFRTYDRLDGLVTKVWPLTKCTTQGE
jgi:hypothetical protein